MEPRGFTQPPETRSTLDDDYLTVFSFGGEPEFNAQCIMGHVFVVTSKSPLLQRCIAREANGFIDALAVDCSECPTCYEMYMDWGTDSSYGSLAN